MESPKLVNVTVLDATPVAGITCGYCAERPAQFILRTVYSDRPTFPYYINTCSACRIMLVDEGPSIVERIGEYQKAYDDAIKADDPMTPRIVVREEMDADVLVDALTLLGHKIVFDLERAASNARSGERMSEILEEMIQKTAYITGLVEAISGTMVLVPAGTDNTDSEEK